MVQVSQENDKKSLFAGYQLSETVLDLSENMVPTQKDLCGDRELPIEKSEFWRFIFKVIFDYFSFKFYL